MSEKKITRPLPTSGEADCPKCNGHGSVARHNFDWTCHRCGYHEIIDTERTRMSEEIECVNCNNPHAKKDYCDHCGTKFPCRYENRGGEVWERHADGRRELFAEDLITKLNNLENANRLLRDTMGKMDYNHRYEREKMSRVIRRLVRYADRVAERHPQAVTSNGQNARVEGGLWLATFDRDNKIKTTL